MHKTFPGSCCEVETLPNSLAGDKKRFTVCVSCVVRAVTKRASAGLASRLAN